jgi:outer membrane protein TolC|tara:strand:- start:278 stop:1630 length:1353 start_codon:yes stop_codon:yes gene_type:complete
VLLIVPLRALVTALVLVVVALAPAWPVDEVLMLTPAIAVQFAMDHQESIGMAHADALSAQAGVRESRADGLPDVAAGFSYDRNWLLPTILFNNTAAKIGSDNELLGQVRFNQPLYTGGLVSGSLQSARARVVVAREAERQLRQTISAQVETILYDCLLAKELARVQQLSLQRARANRSQVNALRKAGRATRFEWIRAAVQVTTAESDSIESANDLALARIDLKDAIGMDLAQSIAIDDGFRSTSVLPLDKGAQILVQEALKNRPERLHLAALADGHKGEERVARAGKRPRLDLVALGQVQFEDDSFAQFTEGDEWRRSWSTGLALQIPLFDGMRSGARVAQARQARRRVQLQAEQLDRAIRREVYRAWMDVDEASQRLHARQGSVEQSQLGLEDAVARYRTGAGTQLEVLDAELTLQQADSEHARARRDKAVALVELERSVGVLGENGDD